VTGLSWTDYIEGHPERLPRSSSTAVAHTWGDLAPGEYRRVTRNWKRWRARRIAWLQRPIEFVLKGNEVVVVQYGRAR
jgi:hypothetical protein